MAPDGHHPLPPVPDMPVHTVPEEPEQEHQQDQSHSADSSASSAPQNLPEPPRSRRASPSRATPPPAPSSYQNAAPVAGPSSPPNANDYPQPQPQPPQRTLSVPGHSRRDRPTSRGPSISFHDQRPFSIRDYSGANIRDSSASVRGIRDPSTADPAIWPGTTINPMDVFAIKERERYRVKTVGERLEPTLKTAREKRDQADARAKRTGLTLNVAIGGQVLLGSLTTAVSAATQGRSTSIATAVLGGAATLIASYLARMRGSSEPESSIRLTKDLDQFLRDIEAFVLDHGHETGYPPHHTLSTPSSPLASPRPYDGHPTPFPSGPPPTLPYTEKSASSTTDGGDDELRGKWDERIAAFRRRLDELLALNGAAGGGENRAVV